jgi:hypothetical protein
MRPLPMFSAEIAERLGVSIDTFYRRRHRLHCEEAMPLPICSTGRPVWDRSTMEAWFGRFHPARPAQAANDPLPLPSPQSVGDFRVRFARVYGSTSRQKP